MTGADRYILPFFIPHLGCPHRCIFCDQYRISGRESYPKPDEISTAIKQWEGPALPEIAFYGGSFTGLPEKEQESFLRPAFLALEKGEIRGIRVSTRPDYINEKALRFLKNFGVTTIELGVQSLDDQVLNTSCRGHSSLHVIQAVNLIKNNGFRLGIQIMPGLPGDTREKSMKGVFALARLKPDLARIYPTLVLKNTPLHKMFLEGQYSPLSLTEAVELSRDMLAVLRYYGVNVIRIGLQPTKDIAQGAQVAAGPFHPAFGELVEASLAREQVLMALKLLFGRENISGVKLFVSKQDCSIIAGHKRENLRWFREMFSISEMKIVGDTKIPRGDVGIAEMEQKQPELLLTGTRFLETYLCGLELVRSPD